MIHNKWAQALILYIGGIIAWAIVDPVPPESSRAGVLVAHYMGAGLPTLGFGLLAALIPATVYRFSKGKWPRWQIWLAAPFMVLFLYIAYIGTAKAEQSEAGTPSQYSPPGCDFMAEFPAEPSITQPSGADMAVEQASLVVADQDLYLRAECARSGGSNLERDWALYMTLFMYGDDMEPIATEQERTTLDGVPVIVAEGSARKNVGEIEATMNIRVVASDASFMILYAAQPSDRDISPAVWRFLGSYSLAADSTP